MFGWIGTQQTLYQGMLGTLAALALTAVGFAGDDGASGAPLALCGIALVLPFAAMLLLRRVVSGFPRVRDFHHGRDVPLPFPTKFVTTSAVQGVAAGVLYTSLFLFAEPASGSPSMAVGQLVAVVLLFSTLVFLRLDFNRFIYKVAFSFVAIGFLLLAQGKSRRAICEELIVSPDTVKTHVRAIYRKLDVHSQQELIDRIVAEREHLVDDADEVALG